MKPPKRALAFLRWFCREDYLEEIEGDLTEVFLKESAFSPRKARWRFTWSVLKYFRSEFIKSLKSTHALTPYPMLKNYFKVAMRNMVRHAGYSFINIAGLASGMAVAILVALWVYDELSFNTYFKNYDRIAQITKAGTFEGKHYQGQKYVQYPLIEEMQTTYRQNFKHVVPISGPGGFDAVLSAGEKKLSRTGMYIGEEAPEMFSWEMVYGNWSGLNDLNVVMISESTAKAFFGDADPLGRPMKVNNSTEVTVTGVFKDFPKNTALYGLQFFEPWKFFLKDASYVSQQGWDNHFLFLYVQLADNKSMDEVAAAIKGAEMKAIAKLDYMKDHLQYNPEIMLHPMRDWHLYSNYKEGQLQNGPIQLVWFIGAIGAFVLLLACINFMNLSTARSEKRSKEVGIRKTIGSIRTQLVIQFFSESFIVVLFSLLMSIAIVFLALPAFNQLSAKRISLPLGEPLFWLAAFAFVVVNGFLAVSYPALY
ncbi:MAG TPA: ABC transporter permease, partial [Sphingobacteriaceae bacterium]